MMIEIWRNIFDIGIILVKPREDSHLQWVCPTTSHPEWKRRQPLESKDLSPSEHKHRFMKDPKEDSHPERTK